MPNRTIKIILLGVLLLCTANARHITHKTKEIIGQKYYLNRCSSCHGKGSHGGNLYSQREWEENFANNGKELIELHDGEDNTQKIILYFKSNIFTTESTKMLKFIQEFAYDSETIPTCY